MANTMWPLHSMPEPLHKDAKHHATLCNTMAHYGTGFGIPHLLAYPTCSVSMAYPTCSASMAYPTCSGSSPSVLSSFASWRHGVWHMLDMRVLYMPYSHLALPSCISGMVRPPQTHRHIGNTCAHVCEVVDASTEAKKKKGRTAR